MTKDEIKRNAPSEISKWHIGDNAKIVFHLTCTFASVLFFYFGYFLGSL